MKPYDIVLAIDPSGSFDEGKGTSGFCLYDVVQQKIISTHHVSAHLYQTKAEYWQANVDFVMKHAKNAELRRQSFVVVIENFTLDPTKALQQSHSEMETPKLIGILQLALSNVKIPYVMQRPVEAKTRWTDAILLHKKIIKQNAKAFMLPDGAQINRHERDAIRHAMHFVTFKNGK